MTAFFEEISKNNNLANEVEKVAGGKNSNEVKAKELILLAQKHHFNFTNEEAADAQLTLKKTLSPEKMLEVSGGGGAIKTSLVAMSLLAGLGVGGLSTANLEASAMKPAKNKDIGASNLAQQREDDITNMIVDPTHREKREERLVERFGGFDWTLDTYLDELRENGQVLRNRRGEIITTAEQLIEQFRIVPVEFIFRHFFERNCKSGMEWEDAFDISPLAKLRELFKIANTREQRKT